MKRLVPIAIALSLTILLASIVMAQGGVTSAHLSDYVTNFYLGGYVARTIIWNVGEPVARPVATPTTTSSVARIYDQAKGFAVPAAAAVLIILVVWAIYRVLVAR